MLDKLKILCITPISHIDGCSEILKSAGELLYFPDASKDDTIKLLYTHYPAAIFVNPNKMTFKLDQPVLQHLQIVCTASTGTHHIDMEYCKEHNIHVISLTQDYDTIRKISSTAEMSFALTLSLIRKIPSSFDSVKKKKWDYTPFIGRQLNYLTAGIIGYGRLGKMYASYCNVFGMKTMIYDPKYNNSCTFSELMSRSDVISLHVHLNYETKHMINANALKMIKSDGAYLINTSRGDVVNELDVISSLRSGRLLGYATDVLSDEMGNLNKSPIIKEVDNLNIIITPHIGGMTKEAQRIAYCAVAKKLKHKLESICNRQ
jgi:D-3-phosphoglycerate dehydrogenase / 2-oxoglutarate reductase